jgi:hypothetical protein
MLLTLQTHLHRYVAPSDPAFQLRIVPSVGGLPERGADGRPLVAAELGPLLSRDDQSSLTRRHALLVPLRRRSVLLLFDAVTELSPHDAELRPLPSLLAAHLRQGWVRGVCVTSDALLLVLDLRALAMHATAGAAPQPGDRQ